MRKIALAITSLAIAAGAFSGGGARLLDKTGPAQNIACLGNQTSDGKCDIVWVNYSVESWKDSSQDDSKYVNCPTPAKGSKECFQKAEDTRNTSSNWGSPATSPVLGPTAAGPVTILGMYTGGGSSDARVWFGIRAQNEGSGSAAIGAGQNKNKKVYECVTLFGADETSDHAISGLLYTTGVNDDGKDYETDVQVCGEYLRGFTG